MNFQQYTTYEESMKLKELGMSQACEYDFATRYWVQYRLHEPEVKEYGVVHGSTPWHIFARIFTRQEIEDYLMEHYCLQLQTYQNNAVLRLYPRIDGGKRLYITRAQKTSDPFPALFDALVWTLKQEKNLAPTPPTA